MRPPTVFALLLAVLLGWPAAGRAAELVVALGGAVTSLDPHYHLYVPNQTVWRHVFEGLTDVDSQLTLRPGLAVAWRRVNERTWEFDLRPGVRFHNGAPVTAADAAASLRRAAGGDGPQPVLQPPPRAIEAVGPLTLRIVTATPDVLLPERLASVAIMPAEQTGLTRADMDAGTGLIGAGPYRFVAWRPGEWIELRANADYWGGTPPWPRVTLRLIPDDASRVAALIAGQAQMIDRAPPNDLARLQANPAFRIVSAPSRRLIYLALDAQRSVSPYVADRSRGQMIPNPLRDPRVRRAISLAINRDDLVNNVLRGQAAPAGQMLPDGLGGVSPRLRPDPYDPETAQRLLVEAGLPDGFSLTLHGTARRYAADVEVGSAIATMLTRAGLPTTAAALPSAEFFPRASKLEFSALLAGFSGAASETLDMLEALVVSHNPARGLGGVNRGRYSNPQLDRLVMQAQETADPAARRALLVEAAELAFNDVAIVPLYHELATWVSRDGVDYAPRADELTLATGARPR